MTLYVLDTIEVNRFKTKTLQKYTKYKIVENGIFEKTNQGISFDIYCFFKNFDKKEIEIIDNE
jgi:uncharacterized membrane protein